MAMKKNTLRVLVLFTIFGINFFLLFSGELLASVLAPKMIAQGLDLGARLIGSFRLSVVGLWVVMSGLVALGVLLYLGPLLDQEKEGNLQKARLASVKLPRVLVLIQNVGWAVGVFGYFGMQVVAGNGWASSSGHDFWWIFHLKVSSGIMAGVFSNILVNNLVLPYKMKLKMVSLQEGERDFFLRNRELINIFGTIYVLGTFLLFILFSAYYYDYTANDFDFLVLGIITLAFLGTLISLQVWLSQFATKVQLRDLTKGLNFLINHQGGSEQLIQLLNFDQVGEVIDLFNKVLGQARKEALVIQEVRQELLNSLDLLEESTGKMDNTVALQMENTQHVSEERNHLEHSMNTLEAVLSQQTNKLDEALQISQDIAGTNHQVIQEEERLKRVTEDSEREAREQIELSKEGIERTKSMATTVKSITISMEEAQNKSHKVNHILEEIKEVAEKTHVLAINASIESAHSGTFGKGFAVIAQEVRKVAEGTAEAVRQTGVILQEMREAVQSAFQFSKEVHDLVQDTNRETDKVQDLLNKLSRTFSTNTQGILGIARMVKDQGGKIENLVSHMDHLGRMSETTKGALESQSSGKERLASVVEVLQSSALESVSQNRRLREVAHNLGQLREKLESIS